MAKRPRNIASPGKTSRKHNERCIVRITNRKRKGVSWYLGSVSVNSGEFEVQMFSSVGDAVLYPFPSKAEADHCIRSMPHAKDIDYQILTPPRSDRWMES